MLAPGHDDGRIPTLDGWRGIAISLVLICHAFPGTSWERGVGQYGVNIFFVLSGYLITTMLRRERLRTGSIRLSGFYLRRFFRLMPTAWLYLLFLACLGLLTKKEAFACILFYRHLVSLPASPAAHFWTLSVEEDFYLFWPVTLLVCGDVLAAICAASLLVFLASGIIDGTALLVLAQRLELMPLTLGCLVAFLPSATMIPVRLHRWMLATAVLGMAICLLFRHDASLPLSSLTLIAFALWSTGTGRFKAANLILDSWVLSSLGLISYTLYVWQVFAFFLPGGAHRSFFSNYLIALGASILIYRFVEQPCRRFGKSLRRPGPAPQAGSAATLTVPTN